MRYDQELAMFVAGPPVVTPCQDPQTGTGGGRHPDRAGGVDDAVDTRRSFRMCPEVSVLSASSSTSCANASLRRRSGTIGAIADEGGAAQPTSVYKMRLSTRRSSTGSFFEMASNSAVRSSQVCKAGRPFCAVAGQRSYHYGGSWTAEACQKVVRLRLANFPSAGGLSDGLSGFMIGLDAEKAATIPSRCARHGRGQSDHRSLVAPSRAQCFGVAGVVHQPADRYSMRYAWPSAYWGSLPLEGGIEAAIVPNIEAARRSKAKQAGNRGPPQQTALAVPVGRTLLGRGDHRPAQDALTAVRIRAAAEPLRTAGPATNMTSA